MAKLISTALSEQEENFIIDGDLSSPGTSAGVGTKVSVIGDFNNDGIDDIAVSAGGFDIGTRVDAGGVFIIYGGTDLASDVADGRFDLTITSSELVGNGFYVAGALTDDILRGTAAGDVNGDGFDDVLLAAPSFVEVDNGGLFDAFDHRPGTAYILYGGPTAEALATSTPGVIDLASQAVGATGLTFIQGEPDFLRMGLAITGGEDLNGDGFSDIALGTFQADGFVYNPDGSLLEIPDIPPIPGLPEVAGPDAALGRVYAVYGGANMPTEIRLKEDIVDGDGSQGFFTRGFTETGGTVDDPMPTFVSQIGFFGSLSMADLNNDGRAELIIGNAFGGDVLETAGPDAESYVSGGVFIVQFDPGVSVGSETDLRNHVFLNGEAGGELHLTGLRSAPLGDINNDGFVDLGITAPLLDATQGGVLQTNAGAVYVLYGSDTLFTGGLPNRGALLAESDVRLTGEFGGDAAAFEFDSSADDDFVDTTGGLYSGLTTIGDINGDGIDDFAVGFSNGASGAGSVYVVLGRDGVADPSLVPLESLTRFSESVTGSGMERLNGNPDDTAGFDLAGGSDVNNDGRPELLIGAPGPLGEVSMNDGRVYVLTLGEVATIGDTINGDAASQTLTGTVLGEQINGLGGFDWIIPGRGNDTVDGGTDRDMVAYSDIVTDAPGRGGAFMVDIDLGAGRAEVFGGEVDQLISIERATGSIFADVMRGTNGNDELRGIGDYDWFIATPGQDTLNGGNGLDMVTFLEAQSSGAPVVQDIFASDGVPPTGAAVGGVVLDLADGSNNTGLAEGLTLISVERVTGSSHQDVFFGDDQQNDFRGLGGFDWFVSSTGGRERYFGGDGVDTVTYFNAGSGVIASLRNGAGEFGGQETGFGSAGDAIRDLYFEIENLVGSDFDDRLEGNRERNDLVGRDGDDYLLGYGNTDYLKGGLGNDTLDGGAGSDFALFDGNRSDYTLTRTSSTEVTIVGADGTDSLINVEYFQFDDQTANIWELSIV